VGQFFRQLYRYDPHRTGVRRALAEQTLRPLGDDRARRRRLVIKAYLYDPATNQWTPRAAPPGVAGPIVKVELDGQPHLFMPGRQSSYLYTP
jgi:hypothetical protein